VSRRKESVTGERRKEQNEKKIHFFVVSRLLVVGWNESHVLHAENVITHELRERCDAVRVRCGAVIKTHPTS